MITPPVQVFTGSVFVETTQSRGWTAEELAARAADKIIYIGDQSHPAVQAQARAFKENVKQVVIGQQLRLGLHKRATPTWFIY
jgi:acetyltransferase-like isoleucine patch superfamily enzyme